ncbi:TIGR04376 family protein [Acaryochloris sp. IP29b_bin.137]|uniref:TIGR04376 family protein n=1 Tax=Acaryochloris sp. IP29b_bin.137 TaxID=2969217 RepID=UPI00262429A2|nr:TIGR04376 family protein [Acaryochloris sp. IP29b_bin.137]
MSVFEDVNRFLEKQLEEFLRAHPHLELQVLADNLREQEAKTTKLLADLTAEEQRQQDAILATANEIKRWHERITKAEKAGRQDLAAAAKEREAALLSQGNQQWGQMEVTKTRLQQTQLLLEKIQVRHQEVKERIRQAPRKPQPSASSAPKRDPANGWYQKVSLSDPDPLEEQFKNWEREAELEDLKRNMGL